VGPPSTCCARSLPCCVAAGRWVEDASWTASMNEGWEPAKARAVMDGLIDTFGADRSAHLHTLHTNFLQFIHTDVHDCHMYSYC
jgi:Ser/Thr protein kinase RdoA (MazF antagonist)